MRDDRQQLRKQYTELRKDRMELRRDIRSGASKDEIMRDRKELRDDYSQIRKTRDELNKRPGQTRYHPPRTEKRSAQTITANSASSLAAATSAARLFPYNIFVAEFGFSCGTS